MSRTVRQRSHSSYLGLAVRTAACATFLLLALTAPAAKAQLWTSPIHGQRYLRIETPPDPSTAAAELTASLNEHTVVYDSFIVTYPADGFDRTAELAAAAALPYRVGRRNVVHLPGGTIAVDRLAERGRGLRDAGLGDAPIAGRYLLQFAYPVKAAWLTELAGCGVATAAVLSADTRLVAADSLTVLTDCPAARYLSWIDALRPGDRLSAALLDGALLEGESWPESLWLQHTADAEVDAVRATLPAQLDIVESYRSQDGMLFVRVAADRRQLLEIAAASVSLLSVSSHGQAAPSDERQSRILATGLDHFFPGYVPLFLSPHNLTGPANQQTVAVFDSGIDGTHPDMAGRILPGCVAGFSSCPPDGAALLDGKGHGTAVAGIVAGDGAGSGLTDSFSFLYGLGLAPESSVVPVKLFPCGPATFGLSALEDAFSFSRSETNGDDKALISNHSWNRYIVEDYDAYARHFDERVLDADTGRSGDQPMSVVVSTGNVWSSGQPCIGGDCVLSPATAKNVITVGATENYRPSSGAGEPPLVCSGWTPVPDATSPFRVAPFSGRGWPFGAGQVSDAHQTRIKPDLMAPGVRVFSTATSNYTCAAGVCQPYYPTGQTQVTYATGTSFAAPAVAGSAALLRKWYLDRGLDPSPSLIKAALIATARDITYERSPGDFDHRPSHHAGWGMVHLDTLTEPFYDPTRFWNDESAPRAVATGESRSVTVSIGDPNRDMAIVLVWSDEPSATAATSQVPLINDLELEVDEGASTAFWRGNNFNENKTGVDDGYSHRFVVGGDPILNDDLNTVEAVFIPAGTFQAGQELTLRVVGANVAGDPQPFSLYAFNAIEVVEPTPSPEIRTDHFEGDLSGWTAQYVPAAGRLEVTEEAAIRGDRGLAVVIEPGTTQAFLTDDTPRIENHHFVEFLLDPNSLAMTNGHALFAGLDRWTGTYTNQLRLQPSGSGYQINFDSWDDAGSLTSTGWAALSDDVHAVRMEWWAADEPGDDDGGIRLWIDGQLVGEQLGLDNDEKVVGYLRFGAIGVQAGTLGTYYLDDFRSWQGSRSRTIIADDNFESGTLSWPTSTPNGGSVAVNATAALDGDHGLEAKVVSSSTQVFAIDEAPSAETSFETFFRFDPSNYPIAGGTVYVVFVARDNQLRTAVLRLRSQTGATYQMRATAYRDDGSTTSTPWTQIDSGPNTLRLLWRAAASGANDGLLRFWINGGSAGELTGLDNDQKRVDDAKLGKLGSSAAGSLYFDDYRAWK